MQRLPWTGAFALAVVLHAALALGYLARGQHPPAAFAPGVGAGVTVGLADGDDEPRGAHDIVASEAQAAANAAPAPAAQPATPSPAPPAITAPPAPPPAPAPPVSAPSEPPPEPRPVAPPPAPASVEPPAVTPRVAGNDAAPRAATPATARATTTPTPVIAAAPGAEPAPATSTASAGPGADAATPTRLARAGASAGGTPGHGPRRGTGGDPRAARDYFRALLAWLARHKAYPVAAKRRKHQGVVTLEFTLARDGRVLSARVKRGSGHAELDQAALDMLAAASPVPAIPAALGRDTLSLAIPIEFSLITK